MSISICQKNYFLYKQKGSENNLSVSLLKQTPATSGCPPILAVPCFPTGIRRQNSFLTRKSKAPDELRRQSRFPKENADIEFQGLLAYGTPALYFSLLVKGLNEMSL